MTASNLSTVKSKATVVEKPLKDFRTSTSSQSGWVKSNGKWYFYESGDVKTGWYKENGTWYYLDEAGIMKTGWFKVGPHWYYAYGSGALAVNTTTPDGYRVNGNGEWVN